MAEGEVKDEKNTNEDHADGHGSDAGGLCHQQLTERGDDAQFYNIGNRENLNGSDGVSGFHGAEHDIDLYADDCGNGIEPGSL